MIINVDIIFSQSFLLGLFLTVSGIGIIGLGKWPTTTLYYKIDLF